MRSRGWFGPKQFGWDVAPRSWQGWTVILLYTLVLLAIDRLSIIPHADKMIYFGLATIGLFAVMVITYGKDERTSNDRS